MPKFLSDDEMNKISPSSGKKFLSDDEMASHEQGPGELESLVRGAAQGATFGFADEATGGIESLFSDKTYEQARDESRTNYKKAQDANPISYGTGEVGGGIATALIPGAGEANLAKLLTRGAAEGAAYGLGSSEADDAAGLVKDTAFGAGLGGVGGGIAHGVGAVAKKAAPLVSRTGEGLNTFAEKAALNATGATGKQASEFASNAGRELLDRGIVGFGDSQSQIAGKAAKAVEQAHTQIDSALASLEKQGVSVDANHIYNAVNEKIAQLRADPSQADVARMLEKELDNLMGSIEARGGNSDFGVLEAEKIKRGYNRKAGNWMDPEKGMVGKEMYQTYRGAVEDAAQNASPELATSFKEGKEAYGLFAPIQEAAERRAATTAQSPPGGFLDMAGAVASHTAGDPTGLAVPVARRFISPRISSSVAVGADQIGNILKQNPQVFGKWAGALSRAAARGGNALSASHYVLQSSDPEYRKQMHSIFGGDDQ